MLQQCCSLKGVTTGTVYLHNTLYICSVCLFSAIAAYANLYIVLYQKYKTFCLPYRMLLLHNGNQVNTLAGQAICTRRAMHAAAVPRAVSQSTQTIEGLLQDRKVNLMPKLFS